MMKERAWVYQFLNTEPFMRKKVRANILRELISEGYASLASDLQKKHTYRFVGFVPRFDLITLKHKKICRNRLNVAGLNYYLINYPAAIIVAPEQEVSCQESVDPKNYDSIAELNWVSTFTRGALKEKQDHKNLLLEHIKKQRNGEKLCKYLEESADCEFVGFTPSLSYIVESEPKDYREAILEHSTGGPALVYKMLNTPCYIVTSPTLRHNHSYLIDERKNSYDYGVVGYTD